MNYLKLFVITLLFVSLIHLSSCKSTTNGETKEPFQVQHVDWVYNATIYEVNIRQYTPEGTFTAFEKHLPRLQELGVKILWLMPIHPIGVVQRKGSLGSYYSVKDYKGVNPEFGSLDDFKQLVTSAHKLGMRVIIDWVANHTSHDNFLVSEHPDWYKRNDNGEILSPFDWTDVAQLDFEKEGLRDYMVEALKYWVEEADIDGYRCDVAAMVPTDFWNRARAELDKIKPVFMLAEADKVELQEFAFDADYGWEFHHIMNKIAKGEKSVLDIASYYQKEIAQYPKNTIRMHFTSNHDENSWSGTEFDRMEHAAKSFAALSFVIPGMPLIYSGQEVAFNRKLKFFDKDQIDWTPNTEFTVFYQKLVALKQTNTALAAAKNGADMFRVRTSNDINVFAFTRENSKDKVFAIFNLSPLNQVVDLMDDAFLGSYKELFSEQRIDFKDGATINLKPWEYLIYVK
jgi:glycosidase